MPARVLLSIRPILLHILPISLVDVTLGHGVAAADEPPGCRRREPIAASPQLAPPAHQPMVERQLVGLGRAFTPWELPIVLA